MLERVAVAFAGAGDEVARTLVLRESECVVRAERSDFQRLDGELEVINRRCGRGEVEDEVHVVGEKDEIRDVVLDEAEAFVAREMREVGDVARDEIVYTDDAVALGEKAVGEMRAEESGGTGDDGNGTAGRASEHAPMKGVRVSRGKDVLPSAAAGESVLGCVPCVRE